MFTSEYRSVYSKNITNYRWGPMRILALDIGDKWTGVAISDPLGIIARPFTTLDSAVLFNELKKIVATEKVGHIRCV